VVVWSLARRPAAWSPPPPANRGAEARGIDVDWA